MELGPKEGDPENTFTHLTVILDSPQLRFLNINFWTFWKASQSALVRITLIYMVKITVVIIINIHGVLITDEGVADTSVSHGFHLYLLVHFTWKGTRGGMLLSSSKAL